jgi:Ca2+-binding EF-hand superfamily protein
MVQALDDDKAAYAETVVGIGGKVIVFEEEKFDVGVRQLAVASEAFDKDGDGMLDFEEFAKFIREREAGRHSDALLRKRFTSLDADGSGKVDMNEYIAWALRDSLIRSSQRVLDLFQEWDTDGSGTITKQELRAAITTLGFEANKRIVDALFDELDEGGDGKVSAALDSRTAPAAPRCARALTPAVCARRCGRVAGVVPGA